MHVRKYVTMRDIAERAGVSVNTVSRVLNNKPDISKETREKILKIAKELGYIKNVTASALRSRQTRIVGVILEDITNLFFAEVMKGIEAAARKQNYQLLLMNTGTDPKKQREAIQTLLERRVEGIVITPSENGLSDLEKLASINVPVVIVGRHFEGLQLDEIHSDEVKGGYLATKHLLSKGRKNILFINSVPENSAARMREEGYRKALREAKVFLPEDYIIVTADPNMEAGYRAVFKAVEKKLPFDGIFCYNDMFAFGAIRALEELGKRVPQDVAVVGYDDVTLSSYYRPSLTTIRINKFGLGFEAFKMLFQRMTGRRKKPKRTIMDVELIVRESA
ncbi:LacI family DNA-binding transcriptional regulator [Thermotoga caldifontis]|uniref:LacI family DNA-binding transcriptional regulator n=1 Tax=Thermotoga caldifontis TaxID=1508419 RepID=UPI00059720DE|nr:LacI family DNA-binding transcriptional regulator [Thermotoga caldifontis]